METKELKSIGIVSAAKIAGFMYAVIGLLAWLIFACFGLLQLVGLSALFQDLGFLGVGAGGLVVGLIVTLCFFPIMYGVLGAIFGAIMAAVYNLVAGRLGGLELQFGEEGK